MAPIQRQKHRGLHRVRLKQLRKSVLRALLRTASGKPLQTRDAAAAKVRSPKDVFILTTSSI